MGLQMDGLREVRVRSDGRLMTFTAGDSRWEVWAMKSLLAAVDSVLRILELASFRQETPDL